MSRSETPPRRASARAAPTTATSACSRRRCERVTEPAVRLVNLGVSGATVALAVRDQLPKLAQLDPDIVTVSIGGNDIASFEPVRFERELATLLDALPSHAIVADLPSFHFLPGGAEGEGRRTRSSGASPPSAASRSRPCTLAPAVRASGASARSSRATCSTRTIAATESGRRRSNRRYSPGWPSSIGSSQVTYRLNASMISSVAIPSSAVAIECRAPSLWRDTWLPNSRHWATNGAP